MVVPVGWALLIAALVTAVAGALSAFTRARWLRPPRWLLPALVAAAFGLLAGLVSAPDLRVAYAAQHHAPSGSPLGYRLAAVWAGQAGGLLLWTLELSLLCLWISPRRARAAVGMLDALQAGLLALTAAAAPLRAADPTAAAGLNPTLQAPLMLIHPPLLFLAYALLAIPFALTAGALLERQTERWPAEVKPWLLWAWLALTAGNGFGGLWAYRTFGWGGFWSWDPVENTAFVPWVLLGAAVHGLRLSGSRWRWRTATLAMGAFLAVLYGSSLVRSGLLAGASVHAYVSGERLLTGGMGGLTLAAGVVAALLLRRERPRDATPEQPVCPALSSGTGGLALLALIVLCGMTLPVGGLHTTPTLYNTVLMPLAVLLLLALVVRGRTLQRRLPLFAALLLGVPALLAIGLRLTGHATLVPVAIQGLMAPLLAGLALAVVVQSCRRWRDNIPAALAHAGVALLLLGAMLSAYGSRGGEGYVTGDGSVLVGSRPVTLQRVRQVSASLATAELLIGGRAAHLEIERSEAFNMSLRRPWISRRWWGDLYVSPLAIVTAEQAAEGSPLPPGVLVEVVTRPGMGLVWLGFLLVASGLGAAGLRLRRTVSAGGVAGQAPTRPATSPAPDRES